MFPLWASFGVMMIDCWIRTYAVSLDGGVDVGRVAYEGAVLVFEDGGEGVIAEKSMQVMTATRLVKYRPRHSAMCRRSIVNGRTMDSRS